MYNANNYRVYSNQTRQSIPVQNYRTTTGTPQNVDPYAPRRILVAADKRPSNQPPKYNMRGETNDNKNGSKPSNTPPKDCEATISATFSSNSLSTTVTSSKDLSNVVLNFCENKTQKFDNLNVGKTSTFSGTGSYSGKCIVSITVKSGCTTKTIQNPKGGECCGGTPPNHCTQGVPNCNGTCGDQYYIDCLGNCVHRDDPPLAELDCAGVCTLIGEMPKNVRDCAGQCFPSDEQPPHIKDCAGNCAPANEPPAYVLDCANTCFPSDEAPPHLIDCMGNCFSVQDGPEHIRGCDGVCDSDAYIGCNGECIVEECVWDGAPVAHAPNNKKKVPVRTARPMVQTKPKLRFAPKNL